VEDKVGQGTFGEVFKARPRGPVDRGERVALKKVLMKNEKEGFPITALREIKILKQLKHPHVLAVKEIVYSEAGDHDQGSIFLVFEFMEHDLGGLLNRPVRFSGPEIMCLTKQLLEGLNYIHLNRIMHRDMKAANLLLNNRGILKIADFGLARGCEKVNSRYTATVCTRWYRPPEILLGERRYTTAIDVWGVGCILAELFVGHPILQGGRRDAKTEMDNDLDQYLEICKLCGTPSIENWPGYAALPASNFAVPKVEYKRNIHKTFTKEKLRGLASAASLIDVLLTLDPQKRPSAGAALDHEFFWGGKDGQEHAMPCDTVTLGRKISVLPSCHEFVVSRKFKPKTGPPLDRPGPTKEPLHRQRPGGQHHPSAQVPRQPWSTGSNRGGGGAVKSGGGHLATRRGSVVGKQPLPPQSQDHLRAVPPSAPSLQQGHRGVAPPPPPSQGHQAVVPPPPSQGHRAVVPPPPSSLPGHRGSASSHHRHRGGDAPWHQDEKHSNSVARQPWLPSSSSKASADSTPRSQEQLSQSVRRSSAPSVWATSEGQAPQRPSVWAMQPATGTKRNSPSESDSMAKRQSPPR